MKGGQTRLTLGVTLEKNKTWISFFMFSSSLVTAAPQWQTWTAMAIDFLSATAGIRTLLLVIQKSPFYGRGVNEQDNSWIHLYGNDLRSPTFLSAASSESRGPIWALFAQEVQRRANFPRVKQSSSWYRGVSTCFLGLPGNAGQTRRWKDHIRSEEDRVANPPPLTSPHPTPPLPAPGYSVP